MITKKTKTKDQKEQKVITSSEMKKMWNDKFDAIFCLNYAKNANRRKTSIKRFKEIGMLPNDNFIWTENFQSPYEHVVFDVTKNLKLNDCEDIGIFNIMMGQYRMIRSALDMGCERALFLEDDNVFLKDHNLLYDIVNSTPDDYDIVLYSFTLIDDTIEKFKEMSKNKKINGHYFEYDKNFWGCGFYSLSRKALEELSFQYELRAMPADEYTTNVKYRTELKKCCAEKCLAIQYEDADSMHKGLEEYYSKMGCKITDYYEPKSLNSRNEHLQATGSTLSEARLSKSRESVVP